MKGVISLRGNEYHTVAKRVGDMREQYPASEGWGISTEIVTLNDTVVICKATVTDPSGRAVATGFAEEKRSNRGVNSTSALENCETSAIGRALAAMGFVGSGQYASADEVHSAIAQQRGKNNNMDHIRDLAKDVGVSVKEIQSFAREKGWGSISDWPAHNVAAFVMDVKAGKIKIKE